MKTIRMTEESYNRLRKNAVNEIRYGTVDDAAIRSGKVFNNVWYKFTEFYEALTDMFDELCNNGECNITIENVLDHANAIEEILKRKMKQQYNFRNSSKFDHNRYFDDGGDNPYDEDLGYLRDKYPA